jgi:hypothetical protein
MSDDRHADGHRLFHRHVGDRDRRGDRLAFLAAMDTDTLIVIEIVCGATVWIMRQLEYNDRFAGAHVPSTWAARISATIARSAAPRSPACT